MDWYELNKSALLKFKENSPEREEDWYSKKDKDWDLKFLYEILFEADCCGISPIEPYKEDLDEEDLDVLISRFYIVADDNYVTKLISLSIDLGIIEKTTEGGFSLMTAEEFHESLVEEEKHELKKLRQCFNESLLKKE